MILFQTALCYKVFISTQLICVRYFEMFRNEGCTGKTSNMKSNNSLTALLGGGEEVGRKHERSKKTTTEECILHFPSPALPLYKLLVRFLWHHLQWSNNRVHVSVLTTQRNTYLWAYLIHMILKTYTINRIKCSILEDKSTCYI